MNDPRPGRDRPFQVASTEVRREGRGQLKIFFGAYAGVGKTHAMLQAARQQFEKGVKLAVGVAETHDRQETKRLLDGLPRLAPQSIDYQGRNIQDFDVDAALSSGSRLILVDELAHANPAGRRHAKRWGDVEALLAADIDVYTTLNVQHLESSAETVSAIIGIHVRETVPDRVFDEAAEVVFVDLPPDDLLARLDAGKVADPATIEYARQHFFRRGNLIALRELALRRLADRVNADVRTHRLSKSTDSAWPTRERVLVCVSAAETQESLIAEGSRIAQCLHAECIVVYVRKSGEVDADREALQLLARQATALKIEFLNVVGDKVVDALLECVRINNVTKLVLGFGARTRSRPWCRSLCNRIAHANPELGMLLVATKTTPRKMRIIGREDQPSFSITSLFVTTAACAVTTLVAAWLFRFFDAPNLAALYALTAEP